MGNSSSQPVSRGENTKLIKQTGGSFTAVGYYDDDMMSKVSNSLKNSNDPTVKAIFFHKH
jgi:hypothetical protein